VVLALVSLWEASEAWAEKAGSVLVEALQAWWVKEAGSEQVGALKLAAVGGWEEGGAEEQVEGMEVEILEEEGVLSFGDLGTA